MSQAEVLEGHSGKIVNYTAPTYPKGQGSAPHLE